MRKEERKGGKKEMKSEEGRGRDEDRGRGENQ